MQAMVWWSVPLVAFVVAIVWVSVANRPRPPVDPHDSMAEHERFREAMGRSVAGPAAGTPAQPADPGDADGVEPTGPSGTRA